MDWSTVAHVLDMAPHVLMTRIQNSCNCFSPFHCMQRNGENGTVVGTQLKVIGYDTRVTEIGGCTMAVELDSR